MNTLLKFTWNTVFNLTGLDISFGAKYLDWSFYLIELQADYQGVKSLLADPKFIPIQFNPGKTKLQIIGCEMSQVQFVGSYYEVSIQVPIEPLNHQSGQSFAHLFLPVNSEAARWAGVDITGFPKFLAQIEFEIENDQVHWHLAQESSSILSFALKDQIGGTQQFQWHYYGVRKHQIVRTRFDLQGIVAELNADTNATLQVGSHPIAESLREVILSEQIGRSMIGHQVSGFLHKPELVSTP